MNQTLYLRDQMAFYGLAYLALLPVSALAFLTGVLPWRLAGWFIVLAIGEHLAQEIARIFNTLFRSVLSTGLFFLRSAAWGIFLVMLWFYRPELVSVRIIFAAWASGIAISLILAGFELRKLDWNNCRQTGISWGWIRKGIVVATPFLLSALSYRIIELADRYIIHFYLNNTAVGIYSFYGTIANVIPAVIGAAVSSVLIPRIIQAYQASDLEEYRAQFRRLIVSSIAICGLSLPVVYVFIVMLQGYLGKAEYASGLPTCAVLLLSTAVGVIAQLPGVTLYARKDDIALLGAVLIGAGTNTLLNILLIPRFGIIGAAWATVLAYAAMGGYQLHRARQPRKSCE